MGQGHTNWTGDSLALCLFLEGTSHAQHTFGRDTPNPAGVGKSSKIQGRASKLPALKLPPVAPLLAWGWPEQEVDFSPPELQKPVQHVPQPSHPRVHEESRWDCKSRVSSSHAEEAPLHTSFVPRALSEPALPLLGMLTTATFGKRRPGCALWLKFAGFLLVKPLQNQPLCWTVPWE